MNILFPLKAKFFCNSHHMATRKENCSYIITKYHIKKKQIRKSKYVFKQGFVC